MFPLFSLGRTALLFAVEKSHVAAVQALVEGKCNVNLVSISWE